MIATILAAAALAVAPTVKFTSDSVYTSEKAISCSVVENDDGTKTLQLQEGNMLGYCIYDDSGTDYIDGVKVDDVWLSKDWCVPNYDDSVAHVITVKTVYTDDVAGMLASAKAGDFSRMLSNPLMLIQLGYYILAAVSLIVGGFGMLKSKAKKIKTMDDVVETVNKASGGALNEAYSKMLATVEETLEPIMNQVLARVETLEQAVLLARTGDTESTLALLELFKKNADADMSATIEKIKANIVAAQKASDEKKAEAVSALKEIASEPKSETEGNPVEDYDGTTM